MPDACMPFRPPVNSSKQNKKTPLLPVTVWSGVVQYGRFRSFGWIKYGLGKDIRNFRASYIIKCGFVRFIDETSEEWMSGGL